jgi:hypothetical protein
MTFSASKSTLSNSTWVSESSEIEVCDDPLLEAASSGQSSSGSEIALYEPDEGELGADGCKFSLGAMTLRNSLKVGIAA